jgi:hypothetical protein
MIRAILIFILSVTLCYSHDAGNVVKDKEGSKMDPVSYSLFFMRYDPMVNQLKKGLGILGDDITFSMINNNDVVNAFATTHRGVKEIILMTGFIQFFRDKDVSPEDIDEIVVAVLAHELAHIVLGHTRDGKGSEPTTEIEADLFSIKLLVRTGFPCTGHPKWIKLLDEGETEFTTHPPGYFRTAYTETMCEREMKKYER